MMMTRLLILGGGVAGLDVATNLARSRAGRGFDIGLVDREPAHVWKPMLHTIASGTSEAMVQQTSFVAQAAKSGFRFHPGEVTQINRHERWVAVGPTVLAGETVLPARRLRYDMLLLALGSRANDFGTPGVAEHCSTIDSRGEAMAFSDRVRARLLRAALARETITLGIVGGGATGVELAAELVQFATIAHGFGIEGAAAALRIVLINSDDRLLRAFPEKVSHAARQQLEELGVEVLSNAKVEAVDAHGFTLAGGTRIDADLKVWAAGVRAPSVISSIEGVELSPSGQLVVDARLVCPSDPTIFALGDSASVRQPGADRPPPPTAQAAFQQASYLVRNLPHIVSGHGVPAFAYRDFGALISLGGFGAYGSLGKLGIFRGGFIRGWIAQLGHILLYRRHQARLYGLWRGSLLWLCDIIASRIKPFARLT
jgi:NADH:ubiquinone reductase (H+-translocating)